jgi:hypothetical protein
MANPEEPLHNFEAEYTAGLEQIPELIEFGMFDTPRPLDPGSLGMGDQTYDQLTSQELEIAGKVILKLLGVDKDIPESLVRKYQSQESPEPSVPGPINVTVYKTKYDNQGLVLHELAFSDMRTYWMFGPDKDI